MDFVAAELFFVASSSFAADAPVLYFFRDKHPREYDGLHTRVRVYDTVWGHKFSGLPEIVCACRHHKIHSWTRTTTVFLRPDIRAVLVQRKARVLVMAESEMETDLPERRDWKKTHTDRSATDSRRKRKL